LSQNTFFLTELLEDIGLNVTCGNLQEHKGIFFDYILGVESFLHQSEIQQYKKINPKVRYVHIYYGNKVIGDINNSTSNNIASNTKLVDEIWVSPHYSLYKNYLSTLYNNKNVFTIPYIWKPDFIFDVEVKPSNNVSILEPNINVTKHCMPPILIAEELYNQDPNAFNTVNVYCSSKLKRSRFFISWLKGLNVFKNDKVILHDRMPIADILNNGPGIFLSHQLMNALNYTYLESLYLNIPLVHNSDMLKKAGFYYPDYDTHTGAHQLKLALHQHKNKNLNSAIRRVSEDLIYQFNPTNPKVIDEYKSMFKRC